MNNIKVFKFNGSDVPMRSADGEVFVNLTQVAKRFPDKNLSQIINSQEIKEYCDALLKLQNYSFTDLLIVKKGAPHRGGGTWAQRKVAIRVAQKLSPELAVWIDAKIEEVLFGAKNNADNNLFSAFSDAFATNERQSQQQAINNATNSAPGVSSELSERTVQLLNYSQLQQLFTELHNIAASQEQNTTLIARQIELLHNLTLKNEKQISHQSKAIPISSQLN